MKRVLFAFCLCVAAAVVAQSYRYIPRVNYPGTGGFPLPVNGTAPSTTPWPESACLPPNSYTGATCGQSGTVPGALHLATCTAYQVTVTGDGGNLSGVGTLNCFYWPETPQDAGTQNLWGPCVSALNESVTTNGGTIQNFQGHTATGGGWIYFNPTAVTVSAGGVPNVKIEGLGCAY